jgi:hypothetical protein
VWYDEVERNRQRDDLATEADPATKATRDAETSRIPELIFDEA